MRTRHLVGVLRSNPLNAFQELLLSLEDWRWTRGRFSAETRFPSTFVNHQRKQKGYTMSLPLSEVSSSSSNHSGGFIFISKSVCTDNVKGSGSFAGAHLVSVGSSVSHLDLSGMSEEDLVARIHSLSTENEELRAVLQHNNALLEVGEVLCYHKIYS